MSGHSDEWQPECLDLDAYLERIGAPAGEPTGETLARLHRAHIAAIPFENLDLVLGRRIEVGIRAVQDKLVQRRRGGYCYEQGVLFAAVLDRLGYHVRRLLARIGYDATQPRARTHMTLHVTSPHGEWLADVGFGAGLLEPLPWSGDATEQGSWAYRLDDRPDDIRVLEERGSVDWVPLYSFTTEPQHASDVEMANHFTSTHPSSPFVGQAIAMRREKHRRVRMRGRTVETLHPDGTSQFFSVPDDRLGEVLDTTFDIPLSGQEVEVLVAATRQSPQP